MDFSKISDYDFESLARDVVERVLGLRLSCYAAGPDGGIDASNSVAYRTDDERRVVVQAKRYIATTPAKAVKAARDLAARLSDGPEAPNVLYFVTSKDLSRGNIDNICASLRLCCPDSHVIHKRDLEDFLSDDANRDILCRYVGLWLPDAAVLQECLAQDCRIDGMSLLEEIESRRGVYRSTTMFERAFAVCEEHGVCLVVGPPGIGKTCLSHLLVMRFAEMGYQVRYSSGNDVASLKRAISLDPSVKEVCFMDDFLGQRYFKMQENRPAEVASLIRFVQRTGGPSARSKVLVLNSRLTIMKEAAQVDGSFGRWLSENGMDAEVVLDAEQLTRRDKAELLCAQLADFGVGSGYVEYLLADGSYKSIVDDRRYNPRVIEALCKRASAGAIVPARFVAGLAGALKNPTIVWRDEYEKRLQPEDRTLLNVLFSLTDKSVDLKVLERCYLRRCEGVPSIDPTASAFDYAVERLSESMLKVGVLNCGNSLSGQVDGRVAGVLNPSINDFLESELKANEVELRGLLRSAIYSDQVLRLSLLASDEATLGIVDEMMRAGSVLDMGWIVDDAGSCYLQVARFREWQPCDPADVVRAIGLCMEHFPGVAPVLDFVRDCDYEVVNSFDPSEVLASIVSAGNWEWVVSSWPDEEIGLYFDLALRHRPDQRDAFARLLGEWVEQVISNKIDDVAWECADSVISLHGTADDEGGVYIDSSLMNACAGDLAAATHEALADLIDGLFEYYPDAAEWLELDSESAVLGYDDCFDYEYCISQVAAAVSAVYRAPVRDDDMEDSEIERMLAYEVDRAKRAAQHGAGD